MGIGSLASAKRLVFTFLAVVLALTALPNPGLASSLDIPEPLQPWVDWVKYDLPELECAWVPGGGRECAWPSQLTVEAGDHEGHFELIASLDRETTLPLPGDKDFWPQDVRLSAKAGATSGGKALVVGKTHGKPTVRLARGTHVIRGTFLWPSPPEVIRVPPEIGWVKLRIRGAEVAHPRLDDQGRLWLRDGSEDRLEAAETDSLHVSVYRQLSDGVPLRMTTRLDLKVSGGAREVSLGRVLLPGSRPSAIRTLIPTQVSADGQVKVYAKPGTHELEIDSLFANPTEALEVPAPPGDSFDPQEVWVWLPNETLRSVELSGLTAVDPDRTSLPSHWKGHTTFLAKPGEKLVLRETRRGEEERPPNLLNLHRQLWLDLDGVGYTVRDSLSGTMNQGWRLNYADSGTLGRVNSGSDDLLITTDTASQLSGVELRRASLNLSAELRLDDDLRDLSIVGWDHDVQSLSALLHLPPGWELLGGQGVDQMPGTWFDSWTLFDFFFLLMVALALGKLCGWPWAVAAGIALGLSHGYGDAPVWTWIHLLASLALLRVLPNGWFRRMIVVYRGATLLVLAVVLAGYAHEQIRYVLHPQVQSLASYGWGGGMDGFMVGGAAPMDMEVAESEYEEEMEREIAAAPKPRIKMKMRARKSSGGKMKEYRQKAIEQLTQVDPNATVQTGPGVPTWNWNRWSLNWTGPVRKDHQVSLWLLSPWMSRTLSVLRVLFLLLMAFALLTPGDMRWTRPEDPEPKASGTGPLSGAAQGLTSASLALFMVATALVTSWPTTARAELQVQSNQIYQQLNSPNANANFGGSALPGASVLAVLRSRLQQETTCVGPCVVVSRADIQVRGLQWTLEATVHVQKDSAWSLPGPTNSLQLVEVTVDGEATRQLRREQGGLTMVRLPAGRHTVMMRGRLADRKVITLQFHSNGRPQYVSFKSEDWTVDGISATGIPDSSIQLTRVQRGQAGAPEAVAELSSDLPPWFEVRRHFAIGLPWHLDTIVTRAVSDRPQLVKVPLVEGEQVISEDTRVEDGHVLVDFPRGVQRVSYKSDLPITPNFELVAPEGKPWSETWTVACSRIWRCVFSELPPVSSQDTQKNHRPLYKPWPGEKLRVQVLRPAGAPGQASTVDEVRYTVTPGQRLLQGDLQLTVRSSQGGWQKVTLPEGAELQTVRISGSERNIRPQGQVVSLPLSPGAQVFQLTWQQPWARGFHESMPTVQIGSSAVNAHLTIHRGDDRWLLWASGPAWGPAVLLWGQLVLLLLLSVVLGRLRNLPLKTWEWFLLALGMVQLPFVAFLPVVGWFALLAWRKRAPLEGRHRFNLVQLGLVGMTFLAASILFSSIHSNLLVDMDMQVEGAQSTNTTLRWYVDQVGETLPGAAIISLPLLVWRLAMLGWALWLANRLLKWVPWGWQRFSHEGLWRVGAKKKKKEGHDENPLVETMTTPGDEPAESEVPKADEGDGEPPPAPGDDITEG